MVKKVAGNAVKKVAKKAVNRAVKKTTKGYQNTRAKEYKKGLLEVDNEEKKYDALFEQKLAQQYREFKMLKEHHMQSKKFLRALIVLVTIVLVALLILSYS